MLNTPRRGRVFYTPPHHMGGHAERKVDSHLPVKLRAKGKPFNPFENHHGNTNDSAVIKVGKGERLVLSGYNLCSPGDSFTVMKVRMARPTPQCKYESCCPTFAPPKNRRHVSHCKPLTQCGEQVILDQDNSDAEVAGPGTFLLRASDTDAICRAFIEAEVISECCP